MTTKDILSLKLDNLKFSDRTEHVVSIFSFSRNVFKNSLIKGPENQGLFGKGSVQNLPWSYQPVSCKWQQHVKQGQAPLF